MYTCMYILYIHIYTYQYIPCYYYNLYLEEIPSVELESALRRAICPGALVQFSQGTSLHCLATKRAAQEVGIVRS